MSTNEIHNYDIDNNDDNSMSVEITDPNKNSSIKPSANININIKEEDFENPADEGNLGDRPCYSDERCEKVSGGVVLALGLWCDPVDNDNDADNDNDIANADRNLDVNTFCSAEISPKTMNNAILSRGLQNNSAANHSDHGSTKNKLNNGDPNQTNSLTNKLRKQETSKKITRMIIIMIIIMKIITITMKEKKMQKILYQLFFY